MTPFSIRRRVRDLVGKVVDLARTPIHATPSASSPTATSGADDAAAPPTVEAVAAPTRDWELSSQAELIEHIVSHHHEGLRRDLPLLVDAARRLERESAERSGLPRGLADTLATMAAELQAHMLKEETMLFPSLRAGARGGRLDMPIRMMERDHVDHAETLARIRAQTQDLTAPADATAEWTALYGGLAALEADLRQHIHLEDHILFARAMSGARSGGG